ncbi:hypothetical protein ACH5RR_035948 [Cinchona calisaya]|uniref:Uncharacterized protein n=1 Tax=Cinchona calisaya TaxID=153742 RepID=A0ABD2Y6L8_9GENT
MGRLRLRSNINEIEEEAETETTSCNKAALAYMVNSEIGVILAVMRRNVRWGASVANNQPVIYLQPFLDVIQSDETGGPITGVALSSIYNILTLDMLDLSIVNVEAAVHLVVDAVTGCRFEITDPASEEVVLMKILQVFNTERSLVKGDTSIKHEVSFIFGSEYDCHPSSGAFASGASAGLLTGLTGDSASKTDNRNDGVPYVLLLMTELYGVPCMVEIFHFLCSLLNVVEHMEVGPKANSIAFDEDVPIFALGFDQLIWLVHEPTNSFHGVQYCSQSLSALAYRTQITVRGFAFLCDTVALTKLLWAFISAAGDCISDEYPFVCDAYLALDGLIAVVQGMAERIGNGSFNSEPAPVNLEQYTPFWMKCLCKFTTLLNPLPVEQPVLAFGDDLKARMATVTVFTIAQICDAADDSEMYPEPGEGKPLENSSSSVQVQAIGTRRRSSGLMGLFSQLLSLDTEEPRYQPTEQQLAAHQWTLQTIQECCIDSIFTESKFLLAESILQLARALIWAAGRLQKGNSSPEGRLWQGVYEHITNIVQSNVMPCALVEKAVFGLLRICQRLLPYKENLADELLRTIQLVLKLDARVADAYSRHSEASESGFMLYYLSRLMGLTYHQQIIIFAWMQQGSLQSPELDRLIDLFVQWTLWQALMDKPLNRFNLFLPSEEDNGKGNELSHIVAKFAKSLLHDVKWELCFLLWLKDQAQFDMRALAQPM